MSRIRTLVDSIERRLAGGLRGDACAEPAAVAMRALVAQDDWLPESMALSRPEHYQQYLLHADPQDRFSLVSFVWGPGQRTPIHNHTVWGVIGMLRGAELGQRYVLRDGAAPQPVGAEVLLQPGDIDIVSPTHGDVHAVRNAHDDQVSISIHLYGGNIGRIRRSVFDARTGQAREFISGYTGALSNPLS